MSYDPQRLVTVATAVNWCRRLAAVLERLQAERDEALIEIVASNQRIDQIARERDELKALLRDIGINCGICMACGKVVSRDGHAPGCRLAAALKEAP